MHHPPFSPLRSKNEGILGAVYSQDEGMESDVQPFTFAFCRLSLKPRRPLKHICQCLVEQFAEPISQIVFAVL